MFPQQLSIVQVSGAAGWMLQDYEGMVERLRQVLSGGVGRTPPQNLLSLHQSQSSSRPAQSAWEGGVAQTGVVCSVECSVVSVAYSTRHNHDYLELNITILRLPVK